MIWRRLRVQGNTSLADLHYIIQVAMGWDDYYLHHFHIYGEDYSICRPGVTAFRHDVHTVFLEDFGFDVGDRFTYTYNFFEDWHCDVRVETIESQMKPAPRCFGGSGRQGDSRYYKEDVQLVLLEILGIVGSPDRDNHREKFHYLIDHLRDIHFSCREVNKQLRKTFSTSV